MQIPTVAFLLAQCLCNGFGKNPRIRQVPELLIVVADEQDDFPVALIQLNIIRFSQPPCDLFIPVTGIDQKALIGYLQSPAVNNQAHD